MRRILTVVGARPQFIKAAAVSRVLRAELELDEVLVHTGQHYDDNMSEIFFDELELPRPNYNLNVGSGSHGVQTGKMLIEIEIVLQKENPDLVLVYGDTNSTLAGALAAAKMNIPVAHVEAGLRSFNRKMPEEVNRILVDHCSTLLFAPTQVAVENLAREGIPSMKVERVGDVMYDAVLFYGERAIAKSTIIRDLGLSPGNYILSTIHRAENTDNPDRLEAILEGLCRVNRNLPVVLPIHPRTRACLQEGSRFNRHHDRIRMIEPVGYFDMIALEKNAALIATDSGGIQKEAFFFHVPCVTFRDETEWVELVDLGWNRIVPPLNAELVHAGVTSSLNLRGREGTPYGVGDAARKIVSKLLDMDM